MDEETFNVTDNGRIAKEFQLWLIEQEQSELGMRWGDLLLILETIGVHFRSEFTAVEVARMYTYIIGLVNERLAEGTYHMEDPVTGTKLPMLTAEQWRDDDDKTEIFRSLGNIPDYPPDDLE